MSCKGRTKLPMIRRGECAAHSAIVSFSRRTSSSSTEGSAHDVGSITVADESTLISILSRSMSSITRHGFFIFSKSATRWAGA
jgi:hypothetical protein